MKVYTLTTQYGNNMGALLQCYALSKYLIECENVDCKVLNYLPKEYNRSWSFFNKPRSFRDLIKNIYSLINPYILFPKIEKQKIMRKFIADYIPLSPEKYKRKDIKKNPPKADAFICGSDQIWNFKYRRDLTYFFDFVNKEKSRIVAYAPSIADPWKKEDEEFIALLRPYSNKLITAVNKCEGGRLEEEAWNFMRFGFKDLLFISDFQKTGIPGSNLGNRNISLTANRFYATPKWFFLKFMPCHLCLFRHTGKSDLDFFLRVNSCIDNSDSPEASICRHARNDKPHERTAAHCRRIKAVTQFLDICRQLLRDIHLQHLIYLDFT